MVADAPMDTTHATRGVSLVHEQRMYMSLVAAAFAAQMERWLGRLRLGVLFL